MRRGLAAGLCCWLVFVGGSVTAATAVRARTPACAGCEVYPEELLQAMRFRLVGPIRGGRATAVAGVPGDKLTFYMGTTGGGVWKTADGGLTWRNITDKVRNYDEPEPPPARPMGSDRTRAVAASVAGDAFGSSSVGALAVAPSDPNVIYAGMGSACIRGNVSAGDGVYRSLDAGATWHHLGLTDAGQIGRIRVHPRDPDVVYVAVLGHAFGPNATRGVYRSRDGGRTWSNVLFVSERAGAVDLDMDPRDPDTLYAATWEALRQPWTIRSGGPGSGLWKTTDGGDTWQALTQGLPAGIKGRIGVAVSPARPDRVWVLVEHAEQPGLYRSDNGGRSFRLVNGDRELVTRAWYFMHVHPDPRDPDTVYVLNVHFWRSEDGGAHFQLLRMPHTDHHDLWIHPDAPDLMIEANDGGAVVSVNGGRTWTPQTNQPTAEMYRVTVDDRFPYWIYGGQQDNTAVAIPSRTAGRGITRADWYLPAGCESATVVVHPREPVTFGTCYGGTITRLDRRTGAEEGIPVWPQLALGQPASALKYRFQWNTLVRLSPHDPSVLYTASNHVHRSRDAGRTWEDISPDLTRDDKSKQGSAGGPISFDNTGIEVYGTIFAFEESPLQAGLLWAGSDDGRVHVSPDNGRTWKDVTPRDLPEWGTVNMIEPSPHDARRVFVAVHRYRLDDVRPYIFRTGDGGATWENLTDGTNGIPAGHFVRVVREDPVRKGLLYAGTEYGLYVSFDDGRHWQSLQLNLPMTPVTDLAVKHDDLVVATQGRSYWILDDLSPLRQLTPAVAAARAHLFTPRPTVQVEGTAIGLGAPGEGRNPPYGMMLYYALAEDLSAPGRPEVRLEILDAQGVVLRSLSSVNEEFQAPNLLRRLMPELFEPRQLTVRKGLNRFIWDLRLGDSRLIDEALIWGSVNGPEVAPGRYEVRLHVGGWSAGVPVEVRQDPRNPASLDDRRAAFELARESWRALNRAHAALAKIQAVRGQVDELVARLEATGRGPEARAAADPLRAKLAAIENQLWQPKATATQDLLNFQPQIDNQLVALRDVIESLRARPTPAVYARFAELQAQLAGLLAELETVLATELNVFQVYVQAQGLPPVSVPPDPGPPPGRVTPSH